MMRPFELADFTGGIQLRVGGERDRFKHVDWEARME